MGFRFSSLRSTFRTLPSFRIAILSFLTAIVPSTARPLQAQAVTTASKTMDVSFFGGYSSVTTDYGPYTNTGATVGANVTRYFRFPIKPSLETRFGFSRGATVNEDTYMFGVRGQMDLRRFHPYGDFLIGAGDIHYNFPIDPSNPLAHRNDNSMVTSPGVGVDVDVLRHVQVKADWQYQFWKLGKNDSLTPSVWTFGVAYRIPFRPHYNQAAH